MRIKLNQQQGWDSNINLIKDFDKLTTNSPIIDISPEVYLKIILMSSAMGDTEWGGYLLGEGRTVDDILVPEQEVTSTSWEVTAYPDHLQHHGKDILGTIHSHHKMTATPSSTDDDYIASNHQFTLIYSFGDGLRGWEKIELPSGVHILLAIRVRYDAGNELTQWVAEAEEQITEKIYKTQKSYYHQQDPKKQVSHGKNKTCFSCGMFTSKKQLKKYHGICKQCNEESFETDTDKANKRLTSGTDSY